MPAKDFDLALIQGLIEQIGYGFFLGGHGAEFGCYKYTIRTETKFTLAWIDNSVFHSEITRPWDRTHYAKANFRTWLRVNLCDRDSTDKIIEYYRAFGELDTASAKLRT